ncbi:MAG: hypothetical protein U9N06_05535 [candidate division WOR-3 bacterium]|nr:hypothetical protein [candidate division WOR-3 bacterium]
MINLKDLKDTLGVKVAFKLSEPMEFAGNLKNGERALKRINLVLTQTFDIIGPLRQLIINVGERRIIILNYREKIIGVVAPKEKNVEDIKRYIYEKREEAEEEKAVKVEEEEIEITVEQKILEPQIVDKIEEIASQYLGYFSLDIVSNIIDDSDIDRNNPTKDQVLEVTYSLKNAASLIIGPSRAEKLEEEILKIIKEKG